MFFLRRNATRNDAVGLVRKIVRRFMDIPVQKSRTVFPPPPWGLLTGKMIENTTASTRAHPRGVSPFDPKSGSPLLNPNETAEYLRVATSTLADWRTGRGGRMGPRFVKIGRRVFYRLKDLEEFITDHVVAHTGAA